MKKSDFLKDKIRHIDITSFDSTPIINHMRDMSFTSRETAQAADIFERMIRDRSATNILTISGSTGAGGCLGIFSDMVKYKMIDVIVATGATIVDMDFFEALGFFHYKGSQFAKDKELRHHYIDRIYDTYIDEDELQECDNIIKEIADSMKPGIYSSRQFIREMGKYLTKHAVKKDSLVQVAYEKNVPIFCPAFSDSSAGFGLVKHQWGKPNKHVAIDSVRDFRELTMIKMKAPVTGLFIIRKAGREENTRNGIKFSSDLSNLLSFGFLCITLRVPLCLNKDFQLVNYYNHE